MFECQNCSQGFDDDYRSERSLCCIWCARKKAFADFAQNAGLEVYPDPTGERYLYSVDGKDTYKKSERAGRTINELWNALVRATGSDPSLILGEE